MYLCIYIFFINNLNCSFVLYADRTCKVLHLSVMAALKLRFRAHCPAHKCHRRREFFVRPIRHTLLVYILVFIISTKHTKSKTATHNLKNRCTHVYSLTHTYTFIFLHKHIYIHNIHIL